MNAENAKKREKKTLEKDEMLFGDKHTLGRKMVSKKVLGRVNSKDQVRPSTVAAPFKITNDSHKLFGLTKASAPRLSE